MSTAKRRKIAQLRALADSTTFPEEAKSARAKADALEAALPKVDDVDDVDAFRELHGLNDWPIGASPYMNAAFTNEALRRLMEQIMGDLLRGGY